ncbi:MAG: hypothetical protein AAF581_09795 [Planctomycetota bacterium]
MVKKLDRTAPCGFLTRWIHSWVIVVVLIACGCKSGPEFVDPAWKLHEEDQRSRVAFVRQQGDESFEQGAYGLALRHYLKAMTMAQDKAGSAHELSGSLAEEYDRVVERAVICSVVTNDQETLQSLTANAQSPKIIALQAVIDVRARFDGTPLMQSHAILWSGFQTCKGSELEPIFGQLAGSMLGAGLLAAAQPEEALEFYALQKIPPVPARAAALSDFPQLWLDARQQRTQGDLDAAHKGYETIAKALNDGAPDSPGAKHCAQQASELRAEMALAAAQPRVQFEQVPAPDDQTSFGVRITVENWSRDNASHYGLTASTYDAVQPNGTAADQVWLCRCDYDGRTVYRTVATAFTASESTAEVQLPTASAGPFDCRVRLYLGPEGAPELDGKLTITIGPPAATAVDPEALEQFTLADKERQQLAQLLETTQEPTARAKVCDKWAQAIAAWIDAGRRAYTARYQIHARTELSSALDQCLAAFPVGWIDISGESPALASAAAMRIDHGLVAECSAFLAQVEETARNPGREPRNHREVYWLLKGVSTCYLELATSYARDLLQPEKAEQVLNRFRSLLPDDRQFERRARRTAETFSYARQVLGFYPRAAFD